MATLIKNNKPSSDPWTKIEVESKTPREIVDYSILPIEDILNLEISDNTKLAGYFDTEIDINLFTQRILALPMLCIEVSDFNDGRIFSLASIIRQQLNYQGDLRIAGNIIIDQLPQLQLCGISSILLADHDIEDALNLLQKSTISSRFR